MNTEIIGGNEHIPSCSEQVKLVLRGQAQLAQSRSNLQDAGLVLLVGQIGVAGELEELPLLVNLLDLAIHILLHLLCLLVKLDQLTGTQGLVVGVDTRTMAHNVEDVGNVVGGSRQKTVLGTGMTARDCLAWNHFVPGSFDGIGRLVHRVQGHDARGVVRHCDVEAGGLKRG